jgi:hypothetical protein
MRFFTMDWWRGVQSGEASNPSEAYERHLASLRPLPAAVAQIERLPSLHDAWVRRIDHTTRSVEVVLDRLNERGERVPTRLSYGDVEGFTLEVDTEGGLPGPDGLGDLGYNEIASLSPGVFEHRLLFSSGIELSVRFRRFTAVVDT